MQLRLIWRLIMLKTATGYMKERYDLLVIEETNYFNKNPVILSYSLLKYYFFVCFGQIYNGTFRGIFQGVLEFFEQNNLGSKMSWLYRSDPLCAVFRQKNKISTPHFQNQRYTKSYNVSFCRQTFVFRRVSVLKCYYG
jgi:hypothetical protein